MYLDKCQYEARFSRSGRESKCFLIVDMRYSFKINCLHFCFKSNRVAFQLNCDLLVVQLCITAC